MPPAANNYDAVPYLSVAYPGAHPERMATMAALFGLRPPAIDKCRVLEIGCASGGNLLPMAETFPQASFVGIDLSQRQVAEGQDIIRRAGLSNVEIRHANILEAPADLGMFDFIICRGVYSQSSVDVQEKILEFSKAHLNPDGVVYISYHTLPGSRTRELIRDMTLFHLRQYPEPAEQVRRARGILDFFAKSIDPANNPHGQQFVAELDAFRRAPDSILVHDLLDKQNVPIYFFEFHRRAEAHGLRYVTEADPRITPPSAPPKEARDILQRLAASPVYLEQYFDFLRNRGFRQSLLCHGERRSANALTPEVLGNLYVASPVRPKNGPANIHSEQPEPFVADNGAGFTVQAPIVKAALLVLGEEWPRRMSFHMLRQRARAKFGPGPIAGAGAVANDAQTLGLAMLQCSTMGGTDVLELSLRPLPVATASVERPRTTALNRLLAMGGRPIVSLRNESIMLGQVENQLIRLLDGTLDRAGLREGMTKMMQDRLLTLQKDGKPVTDPAQVAAVLDESIAQQLDLFARRSLLVDSTASS